MVKYVSSDLLVDDSCMRQMLPKLRQLSLHLKEAANEGKFFAIRFHNDCDGISAGLSLYRALNALEDDLSIITIPSSPAVYSQINAAKDLENLNDPKDTIMLILDHGANTESVAALRQLKAAGMELIVIDHHPHDKHVEKIAHIFISPLLMESGNSSHTVGLICYELAKLMDPDCANINLAYFSLQSDKSAFAMKDKEFKEPIAIDHLSTYEDLGLPFYEELLENQELIDEAYNQAKEKIRIAMEKSIHYTTQEDFPTFSLVSVKVSKFLKKGEFPTRGKIMNSIIEKKERELSGKALICLGITEDSISFRANSAALALGFDANKLIGELKKMFGTKIYNGGGHAPAAALQAQGDAIPSIVREIHALIDLQVRK